MNKRRSSSMALNILKDSSGTETTQMFIQWRTHTCKGHGNSCLSHLHKVCGRIIGYQLGSTDSFRGSGQSINTYYVDGVSVTRDLDEQTSYTTATCPCVTGSPSRNYIPLFVGQSYFCEAGLTRWNGTNSGILWPNGDPLWDGQGCGPNTSSCCTFNSPPWFNVQLPSPTTDDIEVRLCDTNGNYEDSLIQLLELYVK